MQKPKNQPRNVDQDLKAERLAEALRANLGKRKALARSKKSKPSDEATEMPHSAATEDGDAGHSNQGHDHDPLRSRPTSD